MQTPLEIAFHNMPGNPEAERDIRSRVEKLDALYDRLTACRVSVEALHKQHKTGNIYEVHIELTVPGGKLVVSREPHRAKQKYANPDVFTSIRDAFEAAERQLIAYKDKLQGEVKTHPEAFYGQVAQLLPEEDHGFILTKEGALLYFHRNSVMNGDFERLRRGDRVHYVEAMGDTGPTASKVWPITADEEAQA